MDLLVPLYRAPLAVEDDLKALEAEGILIKRAHPVNESAILQFAEDTFSAGWRNEIAHCFSYPNPTLYIAVKDKKVIGFAAFEATARGFFGPIGVSAEFRRKHIGAVLSRLCFRSMKEMGYAYAVIGWAAHSAHDFYQKQFGAIDIPDSDAAHSIYANLVQLDSGILF